MKAPRPLAGDDLLAAINSRGMALQTAGDGDLREHARELRRRAEGGEPLDDLLPECFALVRENAWRVLGERPYDEQMLAGIALHRGNLVEMRTGEGKTLAAVAPVALNALTGRGVHVLTYNDYLARRDAGWMGPVYARLGLTASFVEEGLTTEERRRAYACDVTYLTVKEAGFDLLRDSLCLDPRSQVHRPFHCALVDEADSILIDEARIPLVIAGNLDEAQTDLVRLAALARRLERGLDYATDEYARNIFLTDRGAQRAEHLLGCGNLFAAGNLRLQAELRNALHAEALLRRDVDYIVRDGRIELVDELTGRVAENRHWPDGLQAALEAKEGLVQQPEGTILSSITIQHHLRKYPRLCGMTATARPAADELAKVYGLGVVPVPSHRPCIRIDHPDVIHPTREAKRRALVEEIARVHATGRPILVGTVSVQESESLAAALTIAGTAGVLCRVLNAKNDAQEAEIIAEAGALGAVTISTNMAGRGTDIRLGGAGERQREEVVALGGLYVIGTNRHESRRIDDQLRGRAGRQGDPGASRFIISLEDDLMQRCGIERLLPASVRRELEAETAIDRPIDHPAIQSEVARVQRIAEGQHGDLRARLLAGAQLIEKQRCDLQEWRQRVLEGKDETSLLAEQSPRRWSLLCAAYGEELLRGIEQRITLVTIDRCWSEYLAEMKAVRDEVHLLQLGGQDPFTEFWRTALKGFDTLEARIDDTVVEIFERITITADGVDWDREGLRGPSSTWTYLINDNLFTSNTFLNMANRASFGLFAMLLCWWILIPWALVLRWKRWRKGKGADAAAVHSDVQR